jgi:hypothetical protein
MKRIAIWLIAYCLLPIAAAHAQNLTTVTASSLYKGGVLLSSGQICFTGTDANDNPIPFRVGGGGQEVTFPYCATVTNGAIVGTFQVANPANTAPANIGYRVELFDQYNRLQKWANVQFTGASFNFDNYVPSANLPLGTSANVVTIGNLTVTGSCTGCGSGGGGGGYSTIESAGSTLAQRATANFFSGIMCSDNSGQGRTDCQVDQTFSPTWTGTHTFNGTTNIAGTLEISGAAPQGKIPIGNGTSYVPGDPLVQGTQAAGSTTATNPVSVGGYDTSGTPVLRTETLLNSAPAGTEYGFVTRNIPSGTQTVSVSGTPSVSVSNTPAVTSSQLPSALDGSGYLKVHEQGNATISGTVTANAGAGTFNIQSNASINVNQVGGNAVATDSNGRQILKIYPDTTTASYYASGNVSSAASATDIAVLAGNATNTVLVNRVQVTCTQTTAGIVTLKLIRRSTADSSGTSSSMTIGKDDTNFSAAGTAAPLVYTANPTTGTTDSTIDTVSFGCMASGSATPNDIYIYRPLKPLVLRGTSQQLAVNLNGATVSGGSFNVTFNWEETTTP